ncbi:MAG: beta-Ala-His dipeptidase, partial [Candidatus Latescibacterota bacterium]
PIRSKVDGEWLVAEGTTLGADNGIGLAAALAVADDKSVIHGPLELLFTVDEETGLTGAGKLDGGMLEGKRMLNLDSEELGAVFIGCCGGGDSTTTLPLEWTDAPRGAEGASVKVRGLRGGHSGLDIHEQRGNAVKILARVLFETGRDLSLAVETLSGGNKRNAIAREAQADVLIESGRMDDFASRVSELQSVIAAELGGKEPEMSLVVEATSEPSSRVLTDDSGSKLIGLLLSLPHGVQAMSYDIPGLVETSTNMATVSISGDEAMIVSTTRSSIGSALQSVRDQIRSVGELAGATVAENKPYPGWKPDLDSEVLAAFKRVHVEVTGNEPEVKAIHAGLECGIIGEKCNGMDMISFGPDIENPHSPDERINIPSVNRFWRLLTAVLEELAVPSTA